MEPSSSGDSLVKVQLANGALKDVRYNAETQVGKIVGVLVGWLAGSETEVNHYALRLVHQPHGPGTPPAEFFWLHRSLPFTAALARYKQGGSANPDHWHLQLRLRYLPKSMKEMQATQRASFAYFYDQVRGDYMEQVAWKVDKTTALQLGCLEIRRFCKDMPASTLDKKANLDFLEAEIGLERFFPAHLLEEYKPKALRKAIQGEFRRLASLSESECCLRFLDALSAIARYDVEIFKCSLGVGWRVPVEVVVSPEMGLGYVADDRSEPKRLVELSEVVDIWTEAGEAGKARLRIRVSAAGEPLVLTCPNLAIAESLADLVDGYHLLLSQDEHSVWSRRELGDGAERRGEAEEDSEDGDWEALDADYSRPREGRLELNRDSICLSQLLGEGQFGDVYKGLFESGDGGPPIPVAVKASKLSRDDSHAQNFLHEAHIMRHFTHPHIIRLIGLCLDSPIWIVMELAPLGELRSFLLSPEGAKLALYTLLDYCHQLGSALSYLESKHFVHRDIAARNVLVAAPDIVKLSDFGLSRWLDSDSYYTASRGKLPIKWMAVESINYRRFTHASDVWMLAVAFWEILMRGVKPFQGVRNADVIGRLESGERLGKPELCPPRLYALLNRMWSYDPAHRPTTSAVRDSLEEILRAEKESPEDNLSAATANLRKLSWGPDDLQPIYNAAYSLPTPRQKRPSSQTNSYAQVPSSLPPPTPNLPPSNEDDEAWLEAQSEALLKPNKPSQQGGSEDGASLNSVGIPLVPPTLPPQSQIDRRGDEIYSGVLQVVAAVSKLSKETEESGGDLIGAVKAIGAELRELLRSSEAESLKLSAVLAQRLCLAEKLLSSDMQKVVEAMRKALDYAETTLDRGYRRALLSEAHVLAVDSKAFLETADAVRFAAHRLPLLSAEKHSDKVTTAPSPSQSQSQSDSPSSLPHSPRDSPHPHPCPSPSPHSPSHST